MRALKRIQYKASNGDQACTFEIPMFSIGMPLFNMRAARKYICKELQKREFRTSTDDCTENVIHISWYPQKEKGGQTKNIKSHMAAIERKYGIKPSTSDKNVTVQHASKTAKRKKG